MKKSILSFIVILTGFGASAAPTMQECITECTTGLNCTKLGGILVPGFKKLIELHDLVFSGQLGSFCDMDLKIDKGELYAASGSKNCQYETDTNSGSHKNKLFINKTFRGHLNTQDNGYIEFMSYEPIFEVLSNDKSDNLNISFNIHGLGMINGQDVLFSSDNGCFTATPM